MTTTKRTHGITATPWQLRAAGENRLTQIRVRMKNHPAIVHVEKAGIPPDVKTSFAAWDGVQGRKYYIDCPYRVGDVVYLKERYAIDDPCDGDPITVHYESDGLCRLFTPHDPHVRLDGNDFPSDEILRTVYAGAWCPASTMPAWASRYRFRVDAIRAERVSEMSVDDAKACGVLSGRWDEYATLYQLSRCNSFDTDWARVISLARVGQEDGR